ncbi:hypothetical protein ASG11_05725 [Sphingomonas sp. Leaf357]|uniref:hypothetical protein n=1 Tax=Sphingomonas sp. Leaf357 TaxID=1736350 RepID=UPI0006F37FC2|nr:hypothetical protein [Sphingomonas sp. Leaf357]KQS03804.1 hypothetical protein ASG11_05725 [Sphingomonas sp. Leaf357]
MFSYIISGLSVACDLALPGLIALPDLPAEPDVSIRSGQVPEALSDASGGGPNWWIAADRFLIAVPGIIRMLMATGNRITYQLERDTSPADAAIFLSGTGFGILLQQRKRIVLHASAVRVRDQAVLFCGPSGAGKSTLAAALGDAGYDLVTDDFCGISIEDGLPWVQPDGRQLKLWQNSIDRLSLADRKTAPVRTRLEKFYVEPRAAIAAPLPLAAVYVLREARPPNAPPGIERPNIVDGAVLVRTNAYRPQLVNRMGQQELYFQAAATIGQRSGVFTLTRPLDFKLFPTVIGWLETHWRDLGLLERAA